jgi:hypothetical protein
VRVINWLKLSWTFSLLEAALCIVYFGAIASILLGLDFTECYARRIGILPNIVLTTAVVPLGICWLEQYVLTLEQQTTGNFISGQCTFLYFRNMGSIFTTYKILTTPFPLQEWGNRKNINVLEVRGALRPYF